MATHSAVCVCVCACVCVARVRVCVQAMWALKEVATPSDRRAVEALGRILDAGTDTLTGHRTYDGHAAAEALISICRSIQT